MTEHTNEPMAFSDDAYPLYEADDTVSKSGSRRVIYLMMIALISLVLMVAIVYGLIPYVETFNQAIAPPMPPAIQT